MTKKKAASKPVKSRLRIKVVSYRNKLYFQLAGFFFDKLIAYNVKSFCENAKITILRKNKTLSRIEFREIEDDRSKVVGFFEQYPSKIMPFDNYHFSRVLLPKWFNPGDVLLFNFVTSDDKIFATRLVPEKITDKDAAEYIIWTYAHSICMGKVYDLLGYMLLGKRKQVDFNTLIAAYTKKAVYQGKKFWIINFTKLE